MSHPHYRQGRTTGQHDPLAVPGRECYTAPMLRALLAVPAALLSLPVAAEPCTRLALEYENRSAKAVTVRAFYRVTAESQMTEAATLKGERLAPKEKRRIEVGECVAPSSIVMHSVTLVDAEADGAQTNAARFTGRPGAKMVCRATLLDAGHGTQVHHECTSS